MIDLEDNTADFSLISDLSDVEDIPVIPDVLCGPVSSICISDPHPLCSSISPPESSSNSVKQVRFQSTSLSTSALSIPATESAFKCRSGFCSIGLERKPECVSSLTMISSSSNSKQADKNKHIGQLILPDTGCGRLDEHSGDTSVWLEHSDNGDLSLSSNETVKPNTDNVIVDHKDTVFFRPFENLSRQPPGSNSSRSITQCPMTYSNDDSLLEHNDYDSPRPRQIPVFPVESDCLSLSSVSQDDSSSANIPPTDLCSDVEEIESNFKKSHINSSRLLLSQIARLTERLDKGSNSGPTEQARREAARLVKEACESHFHSGPNGLILNPGLTVDIPEQTCTFNNLMELSFDESEIVRQERERVAHQRKRMAQMRKKAAREKSEHRQPDLLEFFDPNRHVFQSANLHIRGMPSFLPTLSRASDDCSSFTYDSHLADYVRIHN